MGSVVNTNPELSLEAFFSEVTKIMKIKRNIWHDHFNENFTQLYERRHGKQ